MRVLVTGATGFAGSHLARTLAARGYQVRAFQREAVRKPDAPGVPGIPDFPGVPGIDLALGDLRDPAAVARAVEGIDVVYHIAAIYRQAGVPLDVYRAVNATAVGQLVEAAAAAGVSRVVHCSTVGVHGDIEHPPANEDAPLKPGDVYQETKLEGSAWRAKPGRGRAFK